VHCLMWKEIKEASRQRQLRQILRLPSPESKIVNEAYKCPWAQNSK